MESREDIGTHESDSEVNRRIQEAFAREESIDLSCLERVVCIAFKRFPEIQGAENIGLKELRHLFREIKGTGYEMKPYSHLNKSQSWTYLKELRIELKEKAMHHCPKVLSNIGEVNYESIMDSREIR